jgi:hypothetical protein
MITSIFKKSKPINFIIVALSVTLLFVVANYKTLNADLHTITIETGKLLIALFSVFILDFIISKNNLTQNNSYVIMVLGLLFAMFPQTLIYLDLLIANFLVLLALRRLVSLHSKLHIKKKLFDAAFWIALASLFYIWALLFLLIVIVALIYYWQNETKNLVMPLLGCLIVFVLLLSYNIIFNDAFIEEGTFKLYASLDFETYNSLEQIIVLAIAAFVYLWSLVFYFKNVADKNKKIRPAYFLVAWSSVIAILVGLIAPNKNGSEFIFLLAPFSIIMANYLETISKRWFREVFVSLVIIASIIPLLL